MPTEPLYELHSQTPLVTISIIVITRLSSLVGFKDSFYVERFIFCPQYILRDKQYYRLITSAFLHADFRHLLFNMYSFYVFGRQIELYRGVAALTVIYLASIVGGSLLSLFLHRHHIYRAYGASGGVCGIIFAFIFLFPHSNILVFPFPFGIPAWLYAIAYILLTFYGIRKAADNIGHDAHLGGAVIGLLAATAMYPEIVRESPRLYAAIMLLSLGMFVYLVKSPLFLPLDLPRPGRPSLRRWPWFKRKEKPVDINAILDKISKSGMQSLSAAEHQALLKASREKRPQK